MFEYEPESTSFPNFDDAYDVRSGRSNNLDIDSKGGEDEDPTNVKNEEKNASDGNESEESEYATVENRPVTHPENSSPSTISSANTETPASTISDSTIPDLESSSSTTSGHLTSEAETSKPSQTESTTPRTTTTTQSPSSIHHVMVVSSAVLKIPFQFIKTYQSIKKITARLIGLEEVFDSNKIKEHNDRIDYQNSRQERARRYDDYDYSRFSYGSDRYYFGRPYKNRISERNVDREPHFTLNDLAEINADNNRITKLKDDSFTVCPKLITLSLAGNEIRLMHMNAFKNLDRLQSLDLSNNLLRIIEGKTFEPLTKLQVLKLNKNHLQKFDPKIISRMHSLTSLELQDNAIHYTSDFPENTSYSINYKSNPCFSKTENEECEKGIKEQNEKNECFVRETVCTARMAYLNDTNWDEKISQVESKLEACKEELEKIPIVLPDIKEERKNILKAQKDKYNSIREQRSENQYWNWFLTITNVIVYVLVLVVLIVYTKS